MRTVSGRRPSKQAKDKESGTSRTNNGVNIRQKLMANGALFHPVNADENSAAVATPDVSDGPPPQGLQGVQKQSENFTCGNRPVSRGMRLEQHHMQASTEPNSVSNMRNAQKL